MTSKSLLLLNKDLCAWWVSVSHDPKFDQLLVHLRAQLPDEVDGWEQLKGANKTLELLLTITDNPPSTSDMLSPGLDQRTVAEIMAPQAKPPFSDSPPTPTTETKG
jgi:hypothetical protein